jgi:hypothetical protein
MLKENYEKSVYIEIDPKSAPSLSKPRQNNQKFAQEPENKAKNGKS